jgi:cytidylate kinase
MADFSECTPEPERDTRQGGKVSTQVLPETNWADDTTPSGIPPEDGITVTITRQFGSGGAEIGSLVAQKSQLHYIDNEIINEVARRLGVATDHVAQQDEQTTGRVHYILDAMQSNSLFSFNYSSLLGSPGPSPHTKELAYLRLTQKVILELATQGNTIIIGRGSQFLLHNAPRTLHIYIFAPLPSRIENIMKTLQLSHQQAEQLIKQRDYEHDHYLRHYYGSDGHQPSLYHLLINTGLFSFELAANLILQALPVVQKIA